MSKALTAEFDYEGQGIEKETTGKLRCIAGEIKRGNANYAAAVLKLGASIHEAHELLAGTGRDGKFKAWVETECGIENRTAYNYLYAFEAFNKLETVSSFSAGALYALSAPAAPEKARKAAIKRAEKGERITKKIADDIIDSFTVEPDEPSAKPANGATSVQRLHTSEQPASVPANVAKPSSDVPPTLSADAGGECPKGGEHEFTDGACSKCLEPDDAPIKESEGNAFVANVKREEAKEAKVSDLFKTLLEHVRQSVLLVDQIHNATGKRHGKTHQLCIDHVDCLSQEVHNWKRACK